MLLVFLQESFSSVWRAGPKQTVLPFLRLLHFRPFPDLDLFTSLSFSPNFPVNSRLLSSNYYCPCQHDRESCTCCSQCGEMKHFSKAAATDNLIFFFFFSCMVEAACMLFFSLWWGQWLCDSLVSPAVCSSWQLCTKPASLEGDRFYVTATGASFPSVYPTQ